MNRHYYDFVYGQSCTATLVACTTNNGVDENLGRGNPSSYLPLPELSIHQPSTRHWWIQQYQSLGGNWWESAAWRAKRWSSENCITNNGYPITLFTFLMQEISHEYLKATTSCQVVEIALLFFEYSGHKCIYTQLSECLSFQFWFAKVQCTCSYSRYNVDQNTLVLA